MHVSALAFAAVLLSWAAYNLWHQGFLDRAFQWRTKDEAPGQFALSIVSMVGAAAFFVWMAFVP
jgi:hypothetical protein